MHKTIAITQAATLEDWAETWERDASFENDAAKYDTVAYHLKKAAHAMRVIYYPDAPEDLGILRYEHAKWVKEFEADPENKDA